MSVEEHQPPPSAGEAASTEVPAGQGSAPGPGRRRRPRRSPGRISAAGHESQAAAELCARLCRDLLGDFSPALLLLSRTERPRVQALTAYARLLFDLAHRPGSAEERRAAIDRAELSLEFALLGEPVGEPVFAAMAGQHARRPWPPEALEDLAGCARRRAGRERPPDPAAAEADAQRLAAACATALLGMAPPGEVSAFAGALVRLHALQNLGPALAARRCPLPVSELPDEELAGHSSPTGPLLAAAHRECTRLRGRLLRAPRGLVELPPRYQRAAIFSLLAGVRLLSLAEVGDLLAAPPRLGLASRLALLAQARWSRTG